MRTIDRDNLMKRLGVTERCDDCRYNQGTKCGRWDTFTDACDEIKHAPIVEKRKPEHWVPMFNGAFTGGAYWFSCSKCKRIVPEVRNGGWNYCPNCGAEMEC